MAKTCQFCGKGIMRGNKVSHAKNRSKKIYRANLQNKRLEIAGKLKKVVICTKCLKRLKKNKAEADKIKEKIKTKK